MSASATQGGHNNAHGIGHYLLAVWRGHGPLGPPPPLNPPVAIYTTILTYFAEGR